MFDIRIMKKVHESVNNMYINTISCDKTRKNEHTRKKKKKTQTKNKKRTNNVRLLYLFLFRTYFDNLMKLLLIKK